jgi:hypothetical protein
MLIVMNALNDVDLSFLWRLNMLNLMLDCNSQ